MELTCGLCGRTFVEDRGQPACRSCPLAAHACRYVRCPACGYENPVSPGWIRRLTGRRRSWADDDAPGAQALGDDPC